MTYDDLNNITLNAADEIEKAAGRELTNTERMALNDKLTEFLQDVDIKVSEDESE